MANFIAEMGNQIRRSRITAGKTAVEMSLQTGVSRPTIANIESGDPNPQLGSLTALLGPLGLRLALTRWGDTLEQFDSRDRLAPSIAHRLKTQRAAELGITQSDLANLTGLSIDKIANIESGNTRVRVGNLWRYVKGVGWDLEIQNVGGW